MKPIAVVISFNHDPDFERIVRFFSESELVENVLVISREPLQMHVDGCHVLLQESLRSCNTLTRIIEEVRTEYLLVLPGTERIVMEPHGLERFLQIARSTKAGLVYSDFYDLREEARILHPVNDYQLGSVRDEFDFGCAMFFSVAAVRNAIKKYGPIKPVKFAGLYDLRLKLSIDDSICHIGEALYAVANEEDSAELERHFAYVDPRNQFVQKEMELVFTDYLKKTGAYIPVNVLKNTDCELRSFHVEASVIIPVRNRRETIAGAVKNALSQKTDFPFNVIVVDNHSTDGTTAILADLMDEHPGLQHIIPAGFDLGIGGCWNEAIYSRRCGRYSVQLDSDDLYGSPYSLQKVVDTLREGRYAMVVGSYTLVNERMEEIPPGIVDHREWTDTNGHNNALRVNGLGAPRAFDTAIIRKIGFLNISYGEDYAAALRICREYRIGRIFDSLYLCRRWSGNTDAALSIEAINRNDAFKDGIRTGEIIARKEIMKRGIEGQAHE